MPFLPKPSSSSPLLCREATPRPLFLTAWSGIAGGETHSKDRQQLRWKKKALLRAAGLCTWGCKEALSGPRSPLFASRTGVDNQELTIVLQMESLWFLVYFPESFPLLLKPSVCTFPALLAVCEKVRDRAPQARSRGPSMQTQEKDTYLQLCSGDTPLPAPWPQVCHSLGFPGLLWESLQPFFFFLGEWGRAGGWRGEKKAQLWLHMWTTCLGPSHLVYGFVKYLLYFLKFQSVFTVPGDIFMVLFGLQNSHWMNNSIILCYHNHLEEWNSALIHGDV